MQRVPRQDRAFDARRQIAHAREYRQPPEVMLLARHIERAGCHVAKFMDQGFSLAARLAMTVVVIIDADALQIAHDSPVKAMASTR